MKNNVTLWFDKDGVLAQYDYSIYEPDFNAPAPWLIRNAHVYRHIEPYTNICEAFRRLYVENNHKSAADRICNMRVLTQVFNGVTLSEHILDGVYWCQQNLDLRARDYYACAVSKENIPIDLCNELTQYDILLDDYGPNLLKWQNAGGTAIKVVNGINSAAEAFPYFYNKPEPDYLYGLLKQIVSDVDAGKEIRPGQIGLRMPQAF